MPIYHCKNIREIHPRFQSIARQGNPSCYSRSRKNLHTALDSRRSSLDFYLVSFCPFYFE